MPKGIMAGLDGPRPGPIASGAFGPDVTLADPNTEQAPFRHGPRCHHPDAADARSPSRDAPLGRSHRGRLSCVNRDENRVALGIAARRRGGLLGPDLPVRSSAAISDAAVTDRRIVMRATSA